MSWGKESAAARADLARVRHNVGREGTDYAGWFVELSADATIIELAALMHGIGCEIEAQHVGQGVFRLYPVNPVMPPPTAEELVQIMSSGITKVSTLWNRKAGGA